MTLQELSQEMSRIVEASAGSVVRIEGRRRGPSSGVVWSEDGVLVAAHHSVEVDEGVTIGLADGRTVDAAVVGRDPGSDVVVLRASAAGLPPVRWSPSGAVRVGHVVLALSRPGRTVRAQLGIVGAVVDGWRAPSGSRFERYLESDVALRPGFSGGPLIVADGGVAGLNTAGVVRGASLAVPSETVRAVVESLLSGRGMRRGYLGIGTQPIALTSDLRERVGQPSALIVLSVQPESPAAAAGLLLGDVLLKAAGEPLTHPAALLPHLDADRVDRDLALELLRAGETRAVSLRVGERSAS